MTADDVRARVREVCLAQRISQRALGERAGVAQCTVSRFLGGEEVSPSVLRRLARALDGEDPRTAELRAGLDELRRVADHAVQSLSVGVEALVEGEARIHDLLGDLVAERGASGERLSAPERVALLVAEYEAVQADYDALAAGGAA